MLRYNSSETEASNKGLFGLLWLVYFTANLGRLSYAACMVDIINRQGFSPASAGLVVTGFFVCYGAGQIISGYIGGRVDPFRLIFAGLFCTALANCAMIFANNTTYMFVVWCFNGLVQSILWPPILRIIVEYYPEPTKSRVCVNIATTYPLAVMFSFVSCAGIITIFSWRTVFVIYSLFLFVVCAIWVTKFVTIAHVMPYQEAGLPGKPVIPARKIIPVKVIVLFCLALVIQGILRDGVITWVPVYTARVFSLPSNAAILSSGIIPIINLAGIYGCRFLFGFIKDEGKTAFLFFCTSCLAALVLFLFGERNIFLSLFAFAIITSCMTGVNLMLVTFVPARFSMFGLVPFLTGLTNSMVYVGSSVSSFSITSIVEKTGWGGFPVLLAILAVISAVFCRFAVPQWTSFTERMQQLSTGRISAKLD